MLSPYLGKLTAIEVPRELESELSHLAFELFSCRGVQILNDSFSNLDALDLPENLKVMSGGMGEDEAEIIDSRVFQSPLLNLEFHFEGEQQTLDNSLNKFSTFLAENLQIKSQLSIEKNIDWRDSYKKFFKAINLDDELRVLPSWEKKLIDDSKEDLLIEPGLGFGTGGHETTYLCLKHLKEISKQSLNCLDLGCGSGILGIYLEKYKGCFTDYVDVDSDALDNCRENILLNQVKLRNNIFLRKDFSPKKYDIIVANILLPILKEESALISSCLKKGGLLIMSGVLTSQVQDLKSYYLERKITSETLNVQSKNGWCSVIMRR